MDPHLFSLLWVVFSHRFLRKFVKSLIHYYKGIFFKKNSIWNIWNGLLCERENLKILQCHFYLHVHHIENLRSKKLIGQNQLRYWIWMCSVTSIHISWPWHFFPLCKKMYKLAAFLQVGRGDRRTPKGFFYALYQ